MRRLLLLSGMLPSLAVAGFAQSGGVEYERYTLDNGLTVIFSEDHSAPVVSVDVWYAVGSRNERPGRSGFAHLFEHMMFQGSANVGKAEHMALIQGAGGTMNGSTQEDRTNYFQTVPSNRLNLALWLEADRMRSLEVTLDNLTNQQEVVKEEKRQSFDNQPYFSNLIDALGMLYPTEQCFGYSHSVIGSMEDLEAADLADVQAFFDLYYKPNNATLVVVGDFSAAETKQLIETYFGDIPAGPEPPAVQCEYAFNSGEATHRFEDELATLPAVVVFYRTPEYQHADLRVIELLSSILGQGQSSRLNVSLVRGTQQALQVQATTNENFIGPRAGPGFFAIFGILNQGVSPDDLMAGIHDQMDRVAREGVTEAELAKAKNLLRSQSVIGRQMTLSLAERLHHFEQFGETVEDINREFDRYQNITIQDIQRVAEAYFTAANRVNVILEPSAPQGGPTP